MAEIDKIMKFKKQLAESEPIDSSRAAAREFNVNRKKFNKLDGFNTN